MARPRLPVSEKKDTISISQKKNVTERIDELADMMDLDRSKVIGDIVEKNLGSYGEAMEFIHETREELRNSKPPVGFCDVCARQEYMETGKVTPEKHANLELLVVSKIIDTVQQHATYGRQVKSQYNFKCKNGHTVGYGIDVFDYNPFKGKNELKLKLTPEDLKVK